MQSARVLLALGCGLLLGLSGCSTLLGPVSSELPGEPADSLPIDPAPAASRQVEAPAPAVPPLPATPGPVAILYEGTVPAQAAIAARIDEGLAGADYTVRALDIDETGADDAFDSRVPIVAAVGPRALEIARQQFGDAQIVFCHVLEPGTAAESNGHIRGVAPMPPPAVQFAAWAEVDPGLGRIGLITGEAYAAIVPKATQAADMIGAEIVHRVSTSDRETLYQFRRLAPEIDGLWLAPDSEVLSTAVILQLLAHAAEHDVSVLVFSDSLLRHGGLLSVAATPDHVARTVIEAIRTITSGKADALPAEIPLREGGVRINAEVAAALGLSRHQRTEWVVHDQR